MYRICYVDSFFFVRHVLFCALYVSKKRLKLGRPNNFPLIYIYLWYGRIVTGALMFSFFLHTESNRPVIILWTFRMDKVCKSYLAGSSDDDVKSAFDAVIKNNFHKFQIRRLDETSEWKKYLGHSDSLRIAISLIVANFRHSYFDRRNESFERSTETIDKHFQRSVLWTFQKCFL